MPTEISLLRLLKTEFYVFLTQDATKQVSWTFSNTLHHFIIRLIQIKFLSLSDAVLQPDTELGKLLTAMFSPTEPSVIAVVGSDYGTVLYDIRNIKRLVQLFCKPLAIFYLRFNRGIIYVFQSILLFSEPE